jgi:hypothetical protein
MSLFWPCFVPPPRRITMQSPCFPKYTRYRAQNRSCTRKLPSQRLLHGEVSQPHSVQGSGHLSRRLCVQPVHPLAKRAMIIAVVVFADFDHWRNGSIYVTIVNYGSIAGRVAHPSAVFARVGFSTSHSESMLCKRGWWRSSPSGQRCNGNAHIPSAASVGLTPKSPTLRKTGVGWGTRPRRGGTGFVHNNRRDEAVRAGAPALHHPCQAKLCQLLTPLFANTSRMLFHRPRGFVLFLCYSGVEGCTMRPCEEAIPDGIGPFAF